MSEERLTGIALFCIHKEIRFHNNIENINNRFEMIKIENWFLFCNSINYAMLSGGSCLSV